MSIPPDELMDRIVQEVEAQVALYIEANDAAAIRQLATMLQQLTEQVGFCLDLLEAPTEAGLLVL